jgi:hypothetical protein
MNLSLEIATIKEAIALKKQYYWHELDEWAERNIRDVVRKYQWLHKSRFDEDELINAAFVFYRERFTYRKRFTKRKHHSEALLRHITKAFLHTYVVVNNWPTKVPGGTLTKKEGIKRAREILANLQDKELFYEKERAMAKDLRIDYENFIATLPETDKVVLVSMLLGDNRSITEAILRDLNVRNPRAVMNRAIEKIIKGFTERGYP